MSFFSEAAGVLGLDYIKQAGGFNFVNYSGEALYLEGIRRIVRIGDEELVFDCKKAVVTVAGERLKIHELEGSSVIIKGRILSTGCEFREPVKEEKEARGKREKRKKKEVFSFRKAAPEAARAAGNGDLGATNGKIESGDLGATGRTAGGGGRGATNGTTGSGDFGSSRTAGSGFGAGKEGADKTGDNRKSGVRKETDKEEAGR